MARALAVVVACLTVPCVVGLPACKGKAAETKSDVKVPIVTDASTDLLLTWIDEKGDFHVEQKVADVPPGARDIVRVVDGATEAPAGDDVFIADLRNLAADGKYAVRTMKRSELDGIAAERRKKHGNVLAAAPAASGGGGVTPKGSPAGDHGSAPSDPNARPDVIIYGASWCGPCHQAAAYLTKRGVRFVEKDIEADSGANREMQAKLAKAGKRGGSIPVLDVRGTLLVGFDPGSVDVALSAQTF